MLEVATDTVNFCTGQPSRMSHVINCDMDAINDTQFYSFSHVETSLQREQIYSMYIFLTKNNQIFSGSSTACKHLARIPVTTSRFDIKYYQSIPIGLAEAPQCG